MVGYQPLRSVISCSRLESRLYHGFLYLSNFSLGIGQKDYLQEEQFQRQRGANFIVYLPGSDEVSKWYCVGVSISPRWFSCVCFLILSQ